MSQRLAVSGLTLLLLLAARVEPVLSAVPVAQVLEGDSFPDVGRITSIDDVALNGLGGWLVKVDTDFANTDQDELVLTDAGILLREDHPLPEPGGARLDAFGPININENYQSGWNFHLSGTSGSHDDSGIYFNTTLVIQESDLSTAPGFSANTPYIEFLNAKMNDVNQILTVADVDDPNIPTSLDCAIVRLDLDQTGGLLAETVVAKEGDLLPGQVDPVEYLPSAGSQYALNDAGDVFFQVSLAGPSATNAVFYLNTTLVAQGGSPSPEPGRNYEFIMGRGLDLNNHGDFVFTANLDGSTLDDEVIIKNGSIFKREGESFPAIGSYQLVSFGLSAGPVQIDDSGRVLWFGQWDEPDRSRDTGLFLGEELIVQEGDTTLAGVALDTIDNGVGAFMVSDNGQWVIFTGTLDGGVEGAFLVDLRSTTSVGNSPLPSPIAALQSFPNPFRGAAVIDYALARESDVDLSIYDLCGRLVVRLDSGRREVGNHRIAWDGRDEIGRSRGAGIYFVRLSDGHRTLRRKLVRVR